MYKWYRLEALLILLPGKMVLIWPNCCCKKAYIVPGLKRNMSSDEQSPWVSLPAPTQEIFMKELLPYLKQGVMVGSGVIFNFYAGTGFI